MDVRNRSKKSFRSGLYEHIINATNCLFEVFFSDTDNDVQFARALVNHLDIDSCVCQSGKDSCSDTSCPVHTVANDRHQCNAVFDFEGIRIDTLPQFRHNLFPLAFELGSFENHGHCINAGWHMFDGNIVAGENIQNVPTETNFAVHLILVNVDDAEVLLASDTSNGIGAAIIGVAFWNDHRTRSRWVIGVADVDRNTSGTNWENGFFVEYRCTHVAAMSLVQSLPEQ